MKPQEQKAEFIRMRAAGLSYAKIAAELHIAKDTCGKWERELKEQIAELKQEQLNELYNSYYMTKEARIQKLGDTLENINAALDEADLASVPPEKLLDFKLKYTEALKGEYLGNSTPFQFGDSVTPQDIIAALGDLLNRIRAGEVAAEQASKESLVLTNLLRAYDTAEVKAKLDALEMIIGGRT